MQPPLSLYSSKTYTDIFILSIARCPLSGVVAKPGIATGSRSDKRAKLSEEKEETRGSRVQLIVAIATSEQIPSAPLVKLTTTPLSLSLSLSLIIIVCIFDVIDPSGGFISFYHVGCQVT
jgi:hypothetical protein